MQTPYMDKNPHHRTGVGAGVRLKQWLAQLLVRSSCTTNATKTATTSATSFASLNKANANAKPHQEPRHSPDFCTRCTCTYQRPNLEEGGGGSRRHRRRSASVVHDSVDYTYTGEGFGRRSVHSDVAFLSSSLPTNDAKKHSNKIRGKPRSPSVSRRNRSYSFCLRVRQPRRNSVLYSCSSSTVTDESGEDAEMVEMAGVVGAGMAVVKRSSNPYADFRSSMVEMVVERGIASVGKMEELLESYLSLNSPEHHPAIIAAFEDVWETVLGEA